MTELAWLNSPSYPCIWVMVAQGPIRGQRRKRKLTVDLVYCREVAELDDSLSSCMRQVEERYRVEQPKRVREQSTAFGLFTTQTGSTCLEAKLLHQHYQGEFLGHPLRTSLVVRQVPRLQGKGKTLFSRVFYRGIKISIV